MTGVLDLLRAAPLLAEVPAGELSAIASWWEPRVLGDGVALWAAGEPGGDVAVVVSGALEARLGGWRVGRIGPHELVGEGSAFGPARTRVASVVSVGTTELVTLSAARLQDLRAQATRVYDALLSEALRTLSERVTRTDDRISELARGSEPAPVAATPLTQLWRRMKVGFAGEPVPVTHSLRALPGLRQAEGSPLVRIGAAMMPRRLDTGEALFLEGDAGTSAFLLAEGCIGVYRSAGGDRREKLAELRPTTLVGTGALLASHRRNASCVATAPTWVYEMDRDSLKALSGEPLRLWREALLAALHFQLGNADQHLASLAADGADALRRAAVGVVAFEAERTPDVP